MPAPKPATEDAVELGLAIEPAPETNVQTPVPTVGVLPLNVALVAQVVCDEPAAALVGILSTVMVNVDVEEHTPFVMAHLNTLRPKPTFVIALFGEDGATIVAVPTNNNQLPVPTIGVFAFNVVDGLLTQMV